MDFRLKDWSIVSLTTVSEYLAREKRLTSCLADHVSHLREDILFHRIKYSLTSMEADKGEAFLKKAGRALEK